MKKTIIAALAIAAMAGCTQASDTDINTSSTQTSFSSTIQTRATGDQWESGDAVGIMVTSEGDLHSSYRYNNKYTVSFSSATPETGRFVAASSSDEIYYPDSSSEYIDFYAYYPYNADLVAEDMAYPIDITTQETPQNIDFMEASTSGGSGYNKNSGTVELAFERNMAKISLKLVAGEGVALSDITAISFEGFYTSATYEFPTNKFTDFGGADQAITPYEEGNDTYSAILIPEMATSHMVYFTLTGDKELSLDLSSATLTRGKHLSYTVTLSWGAVEFEDNNITDWVPDDSGSVSPEGIGPDIIFNAGTYEIYSAKGLSIFAGYVNEDRMTSIDGKLMKDIDLSDVCGSTVGDEENGTDWTAIGKNVYPYTGNFDGCGYTVSNLYILVDGDDATSYQALFGNVNGSTIQNITLENVDVTASSSVGGVVGAVQNGTLSNLHVSSGKVAVTNHTGGGVVGSATNSTIINCSNRAAVSASGSGYSGNVKIGGILGANETNASSYIYNCYNLGSVTVNDSSYMSIGGVVGYTNGNSDNTYINNCYSAGTVSGGDTAYMGGILGCADRCTELDYCYCANTNTLVGTYSTTENYESAIVDSTTCETMSTDDMQKDAFVSTLNTGAAKIIDKGAYGWKLLVTEYDDYPTLSADVTLNRE
ncbi:MAG: fimbrillin family protein [Rikenellaceae bacterium]